MDQPTAPAAIAAGQLPYSLISGPVAAAPMQLGKVEFDDGTWRTAFGCDGAAATGPDISEYGSWPAAIAAGAVG